MSREHFGDDALNTRQFYRVGAFLASWREAAFFFLSLENMSTPLQSGLTSFRLS